MVNEKTLNDYRRFARWYDAVFGPVLQPGRRAAIRALDLSPGQRILEVGVGTGLSLPLYPEGVQVTGIDISREMLARARARVARQHLESVEALLEMDAQAMDFPDDTFDAVLAMYAVAVVPDAAALIREITRVCKPDGTIVIVNHFKTDNRALAACDRLLRPLHRRVSHRTDIELNRFVKQTGLEVVSQAGTNLFRYSTLLTCRNRA